MSSNQTTEPTVDSIIKLRTRLIGRLTEFTTELDQKLPSNNKSNKINKLSTETLKELLKTITGIRDELIVLRTSIGRYFLGTLRRDLENKIISKLPTTNGEEKTQYSNKSLVMSLISFNKSIKNFISNKNVSNAKVYTEKVVKFEQFIKAYKNIINKLNSEGDGEELRKFKNMMNASKRASNQLESQAAKAGTLVATAKRVFGMEKKQNKFQNEAYANMMKEKERLLNQIGKTADESRSIAGNSTNQLTNSVKNMASGAAERARKSVANSAAGGAGAGEGANNGAPVDPAPGTGNNTNGAPPDPVAVKANNGAPVDPAPGTGNNTNGAPPPDPVAVKANNKVQSETVSKVQSAIFKLGRRTLNNNQTTQFNNIINLINRNAIISYRTALQSGSNNNKNEAARKLSDKLQQQKATQNLKNAVNKLNKFVGDIVGETSAAGAARGETSE